MSKRAVLAISGSDRVRFLQSLITNSVEGKTDCLIYAALLTPQGKYLFDFFLLPQAEQIFLDVSAERLEALKAHLALYKLRADVHIARTDYHVHFATLKRAENAYPDPRHPALGWRSYQLAPATAPPPDFLSKRVAYVIPEDGIELIANSTYILEAGFERLNGVDFKKGCFVGQEIVARMKHKTALRKGFCRVVLAGKAPPQTPLECNGKEVGRICSIYENRAIAYLHYDRVAAPPITANGVEVTLDWRPDECMVKTNAQTP